MSDLNRLERLIQTFNVLASKTGITRNEQLKVAEAMVNEALKEEWSEPGETYAERYGFSEVPETKGEEVSVSEEDVTESEPALD